MAALVIYSLSIPVTPSIDKNLLIRDFSYGSMKKGDYISFYLNHELIGGNQRVIKQIGCSEGQDLERKESAFYCDDAQITNVRLHRDSGEELPQFHYNGPVPPNMAFVYGSHKYSFGSRHWGFVDLNNATRLIPIF
jgi:Peptidase S26.